MLRVCVLYLTLYIIIPGFRVCIIKIYSYFHHHGPSTSIASQSSLEIILEHGAIENGPFTCVHRLHKNRHEYEQIGDDVAYDDIATQYNNSYNNTSNHPGHGFIRSGDEQSISGDGSGTTTTTSKRVNGWRNVRAVMAYYYSLRKIKRNGCTFRYLYPIFNLFNNLLRIRYKFDVVFYAFETHTHTHTPLYLTPVLFVRCI